MNVQDVLDEYEHYPRDAEVCPYCYRLLLEIEDEPGAIPYCPNEMCLYDDQT